MVGERVRTMWGCLAIVAFGACDAGADGSDAQVVDGGADDEAGPGDAGDPAERADRGVVDGGVDSTPACACPDELAPVCGADGQTYLNACRAGCADAAVAHPGECRARACQGDDDCRPSGRCEAGICVPAG